MHPHGCGHQNAAKITKSMSEYKFVKLSGAGLVTTVTLNRPETRNALSTAMLLELVDALQKAQADDASRVIVLDAVGDGFCAGADLSDDIPNKELPGVIKERLEREFDPVIKTIVYGEKPVIAAVNGAAAGYGASIALACDLAIMADNAFMFSVFSNINLVPDGGMHKFLLDRVGHKRAFEIAAFSQRLSSQECLSAGLCNKVVPADQLDATAQQVAAQLAERAPMAVIRSKRILNHAANHDLASTMAMEAELQDECFHSRDFVEGVSAFFEKRQAKFEGR